MSPDYGQYLGKVEPHEPFFVSASLVSKQIMALSLISRFTLHNTSPGTMWFRYGTAAASSTDYSEQPVPSGFSFTPEPGEYWSGPIQAIWDDPSGGVQITPLPRK